MVTDNNPESPFFRPNLHHHTAYFSVNGAWLDSPIWETHSDDGGRTWNAPVQVNTPGTGAGNDSNYFRAGAGAPGCENCAVFHGDYIGLAYGADGKANAAWTDMRDLNASTERYLQFIYFAQR